jgi:hypothetical protein
VRLLKSVDKNGKPYSDAIDSILHALLGVDIQPAIKFELASLKPLPDAPGPSGQVPYRAEGGLTIGGVTKDITMDVGVKGQPGGYLQFSGSVEVKMSEFGILPPPIGMDGRSVKVDDAVTITYYWSAAQSTKLEAAK